MKEPTIKTWHGIEIVKISSVGGNFSDWLYGQTLPLVEDDENPTNWAYYSDYLRWANGLPIID
jgi:hypothetical protein